MHDELQQFCESVWGWNRQIYIHQRGRRARRRLPRMQYCVKNSLETFLFLFSGGRAAHTNGLCLLKVVVRHYRLPCLAGHVLSWRINIRRKHDMVTNHTAFSRSSVSSSKEPLVSASASAAACHRYTRLARSAFAVRGINSTRIVIDSLDECKTLGECQIGGQRYSETPMILLDRECLIQTIERRARHLFGPEIRYELRSPCLGSLDRLGIQRFKIDHVDCLHQCQKKGRCNDASCV